MNEINKGGRPSKYEEIFCEKVVELMREGASIAEIAFELEVSKNTLYQWMEKNREFQDAINKGRDFSEGWWCKKGRKNIENKEFNSTLWYMNMKNRFGWADKTESNHNVNVKQEDAIKDLG